MTDEVAPERRTELEAWARMRGGPDATVSAVALLAGHGGETLAFDYASPEESLSLVVRLAPAGVPRRGNTDVLRQGPLLRALTPTDVPVAEVVDTVTAVGPFGRDALVQRRLNGRPLSLFPPAPPAGTSIDDHLRRATEALARLHTVDHVAVLAGWDEPQAPLDAVARWARLVAKQPEDAWAEGAAALAEELTRSCPEQAPVGICHGDYQTNNVLFDEGGMVVGIVDWELAHIGPTPLDVAWLAMMADPGCWGEPHRSRLRVIADPGAVLGWYADAGGQLPDPDWYFALACFRYAVICGYNVRLHRTGRRVDPFNGDLAGTVPVLLERGLTILRA